jgi:hypothetical protein
VRRAAHYVKLFIGANPVKLLLIFFIGCAENRVVTTMLKFICIMLACAIAAGSAGCKNKPDRNQVEIDQFETDRSNNYRYIFRDLIDKEKNGERKENVRKDPFKK